MPIPAARARYRRPPALVAAAVGAVLVSGGGGGYQGDSVVAWKPVWVVMVTSLSRWTRKTE
jgi:hypothetical protein